MPGDEIQKHPHRAVAAWRESGYRPVGAIGKAGRYIRINEVNEWDEVLKVPTFDVLNVTFTLAMREAGARALNAARRAKTSDSDAVEIIYTAMRAVAPDR